MQFVLVIHHGTYPLPGTPGAEAVSAEDKKAAYADWAAISAMENVAGGPPLGLPADATTIRVENGSTVRTEGPFLDAASAVGGFLVVEADDLEAAVAVAARVPQARLGGAVEVRRVARYW
ncbi:YciI family protein [Kutzneria sp. CA-103260]|uniref:YciI family protein n=1 Tax=Kutzneria sp. CA-103260 TaxID=2802641 RepID=UPI001BA5BAEC|nr:YciI family protein [Kutzneria sp. CA-103260]QUQ66701.1 YCII-related domain protein [Kutzneria sp. CA-103260]